MCILSRRLWLMSLPVSLMTDCGGLLNRRSPGRKRCCHTGLFTRDIRFTLHTDGSCPELSNFSSHGASRRVTVLLSRICELSNFSSHGWSRRSRSFHTSFLFVPNYRIVEFFFTRRVTESLGILSRDLSFGLTDQREVICELIYFHAECHGWLWGV